MRALLWLAAALVAAAMPSAVYAQDATPPPSPPYSQGPLVIERIPDTLVVAPEYKLTNFDSELGQLAGVHAGILLQEAVFVGGGFYWLVNGSSDFRLGYGGLMLGVSVPAGARVRFGGRGLVGIGTATLGSQINLLRGETLARFGRASQPAPAIFPPVHLRARDDFALVEPEGSVVVRLTDHLGIDVSAGYRFTWLEDVLQDRLDGATGSVALQVGW